MGLRPGLAAAVAPAGLGDGAAVVAAGLGDGAAVVLVSRWFLNRSNAGALLRIAGPGRKTKGAHTRRGYVSAQGLFQGIRPMTLTF